MAKKITQSHVLNLLNLAAALVPVIAGVVAAVKGVAKE